MNTEFYLIQIKILKDGQWFECRDDKGEIMTFESEPDAVIYSKSEQFAKLCPFAIETRLVKQEILIHQKGIGL